MINVVTATYPFLELLPGRNLVILSKSLFSIITGMYFIDHPLLLALPLIPDLWIHSESI